MGQLIAQAPFQSSAPSRERIRQFITTCINRNTGGNVTAFADRHGIDRFVIYAWRRKHLPPTDLVLRICYRLGVSFFDLVTNGDVFPNIELNEQFQLIAHNASTTSYRNSDVTRLGLLVALEEEPPPTLRQVADRLGYKLTRSLHTRYPELTKRLTLRQRASRPKVRGRFRKKDPAAIKLALEQALENEPPPALSDIAGSLGYENLRPLRSMFSMLCEAILVRRARYWEKQRNGIRLKLNAALLECPPPSLSEVSARVGYKSGAGLRRSYPELFAAILKRHTKYRKTQFYDIRCQLKAVLREESPPTLRATAERLGKKYLYLHEHFPEECKAIIKRYAQFKKKSILERKARAMMTMRRLALELYAKDKLSYSQLKRASNGPTGLDASELCAVLRDVKRELGLTKSG
jgi:methylphosphotriester-DNA--protein-cysteine methyltransferase